MESQDLPANFDKYPKDTQYLIMEYLENLSTIEKKAYKIAQNHLGTSFNVVKSNGFNDWKKKRTSS
jgi:hypothetical protein